MNVVIEIFDGERTRASATREGEQETRYQVARELFEAAYFSQIMTATLGEEEAACVLSGLSREEFENLKKRVEKTRGVLIRGLS